MVVSIVLSVAIAAFVTFGDFVEIDESKEVTGVLIVHSLVKSSIFSIYISLPNCIFALAENGDQNEYVLKGIEEQRCHEQFAVSDVDGNVDVEPA